MQGTYIPRSLERDVRRGLDEFPAVAVLGPRQCGKSTLAKHIIESYPHSIYLDLERPSDERKLTDPELFFEHYRDRLVCLDEIQRKPEIFTVLRNVIDERKRPGQFLILGSASGDLLRQSSESLAGRIAHLELAPFGMGEIPNLKLNTLWLRGGFPSALLAKDDYASFRWRQNFVRTFLERDIPQLGIRIPAASIERLWRMCAHYHSHVLNLSAIGSSLGITHHTARSYIDLLSKTFMLRLLPPYESNAKKRLVKSPKLYIRDSGLLHTLLGLREYDDLLAHPVFGGSWEGFAIENLVACLSDWNPSFYRTSAGAELDLVLERGRHKIAIECKASSSPEVTKGFWYALDDIRPDEAWIVAPVRDTYPLKKGVKVTSLGEIILHLKRQFL
ncbi:MAG: ATP-binding protein [Desulfomonilia bacterium]|jgi:predicted AAA+ superfamily ATPase